MSKHFIKPVWSEWLDFNFSPLNVVCFQLLHFFVFYLCSLHKAAHCRHILSKRNICFVITSTWLSMSKKGFLRYTFIMVVIHILCLAWLYTIYVVFQIKRKALKNSIFWNVVSYHRRIQDFLRGAQGRVHPDVYWVHSSEDSTAQVTFFNKHG